jgi:hypothetical protein
VQQEALGTSRFEASSFKQRYEANDSTMCGNAFMEQPVVGLQDVITEAPIQSSDVIWPGGCDAYMPYVTLEPGLHWDADRGTSAQLSNGTTAFAMGINGSDGWTSNVLNNYQATMSAPISWICGYPNPADSQMLFQTLIAP